MTNIHQQSETIDVTPSTNGVARFARKMLAEAPEGSSDAQLARMLLTECGETA